MGILSSDSNYFGLDIGTTAVRLVQLKKLPGIQPSLVTYGDVPLPHELMMSDSQIDEDKIAQIIAGLVRDTKVTTKAVVAGLASSQAFATVITTPKLSPADLSKAMKLQAEQYIPMAVDSAKVDWQIVGPGKNDQEMQVLLVAAPNSAVNKVLNIIQKAGLELSALELNAVAVTRSLMPNLDIAVLILDVGSSTTDITIVHQQAPKLIRSVNVGGMTFQRSVEQSLGLESDQATQFLHNFGLTKTKLEGQVLKAVKPSLDSLTDEIDRSIKFFASQNEGVKLEKVILTGGTSRLPELQSYIANATQLPVEMGNSWVGVSYPASLQDKLMGISLDYSVAIGLAQRSFI